tara:strand:+ start:200 stop:478 length:279 start_codon:yes stop_codon:yes gene_type:complete
MKTLIQNTQVDTLGLLLAQQADLTSKIDAIKANLKEEGQGIYEGAMYKANVIVSNRSTVDFKQVFVECSVPAEVIARNTKAQEIITVKLTSR